jgi:hypothetical protein
MEQVVTQNPALLQWFENSALPKKPALGKPVEDVRISMSFQPWKGDGV